MSKDLPPSRTAEQFVVRFPDGMRDRIAQAAKDNNRSMNSEIVARLEQSFEPKQPHMDLATMAKAIQEMRGTLSNQQQYIAELVERGYSVKVDQEGILSAQHTFRKPAPQAKTITIENPPEEGSIPAPPAAKRVPKKPAA